MAREASPRTSRQRHGASEAHTSPGGDDDPRQGPPCAPQHQGRARRASRDEWTPREAPKLKRGGVWSLVQPSDYFWPRQPCVPQTRWPRCPRLKAGRSQPSDVYPPSGLPSEPRPLLFRSGQGPLTRATSPTAQCPRSTFQARRDASGKIEGIHSCREQISNGCYMLGKGLSGKGLRQLVGWTPNPGSGNREGFPEEVMTELRLKMHGSLPVFPLYLEHCMNERMRKNVPGRKTA